MALLPEGVNDVDNIASGKLRLAPHNRKVTYSVDKECNVATCKITRNTKQSTRATIEAI